jgi:hypothetical protein
MNPTLLQFSTLTTLLWLLAGGMSFAQEVTGLNLINADSNAVIAPLVEGDTLDLAPLQKHR